MIGIYKITNKLNNKCYIGQSINIEKRLKTHKLSKNDSLIDNDIKKYGVENFSFEVVEECDYIELNIKESYYIKKYNSINHGYNIKEGSQKYKNINAINNDMILTPKQYLIYSYLLSISIKRNNEYYVSNKKFKIKDVCEQLNISQPTWRNALKKLISENYIEQTQMGYIINYNKLFAPLSIELIKFLIPFGIQYGGNIIFIYALIYYYWNIDNIYDNDCEITIHKIKKFFKDKRTAEDTKIYQKIFDLFKNTGLINMYTTEKKNNGVSYTVYHISSVSLDICPNIELIE